MADVIDLAQDQEAMNIAHSLRQQAIRAQLAPKLTAIGHCLNHECGEHFSRAGQLFCGPACEQRHAQIERIKRQ